MNWSPFELEPTEEPTYQVGLVEWLLLVPMLVVAVTLMCLCRPKGGW